MSMKTLVSRIYTLLALAALAGILGYTAWDLTNRSQAAELKAKAELRIMAGHLTDLFIQAKGFPGKPIAEYFPRIAKNSRWQGFALGSDKDGLEYYWGPKPSTTLPSSPILASRVQTPDFTPEPFLQTSVSLEVFVPDLKTYTLRGLYQSFTRQELFEDGLRLLLALAALILLSGVMYVLTRRSDEEPAGDSARPDREAAPADPWTADPDDLAVPAFPAGNEDDPLDSLPALNEGRSFADEVKKDHNEFWFDDEDPLGHTPALSTDELPPLHGDRSFDLPDLDREPAPVSPRPQQTPAKTGPAGAAGTGTVPPSPFNPRSGLSWASFLPGRLDFELERCASFNQDLTLILISCPEILVQPEQAFPIVGEAVTGYWQFKDLDFEFMDEGVAIISPNASLEATIRELAEFLRKLERRLPDYHFYCGLSSRNGRLIDSETLLAEATKALEKSKTSHDPIIGFRSDPDRYRQFLSSGATG